MQPPKPRSWLVINAIPLIIESALELITYPITYVTPEELAARVVGTACLGRAQFLQRPRRHRQRQLTAPS
jgi:hypothetical protein